MISDRLYGLAFEYKKTKLWDRLWDTQVFAVKLSDGRIGYISVMGNAGQHCALGLYIGREGLDSLRRVERADEFSMPLYEFQELLSQQDCLQCVFSGREDLTKEEREDVKRYARGHGIKIAGKNAYPQFMKFRPNYYPWYLEGEGEQEFLCEALAGAIALAELLGEKSTEEIGLGVMEEETADVLLLERQGEGYVLGRTDLPEEKPVEIPAPAVDNDIMVAKLKKLKKGGVWECGVIRYPEPVQNAPDEVPHFPIVLLVVESSADIMLPVAPVEFYEENPVELLNLFMEALVEHKVCPAEIKAQDERTYKFAQDLCRRLGIALSIAEVPALEEAEAGLMEHLDRLGSLDMDIDGVDDELDRMDNALDMLGALLDMDEKKLDELSARIDALSARLGEDEDLSAEDAEGFLRILPGGLGKQFRGILEDAAEKGGRSNRIVEFPGAGRRKPEEYVGPERSFVISVSLWKGCYRHIQIAGESTLFDLHGAILDAFAFDDDHAHAFFMDNVKWGHGDCYYAEGVDEGYRTTDAYQLNQVGLCKGKQFKYVFDFGDEWVFQCKVLRVVDGGTSAPVVVKSKGEAPDQYGSEEEDWDGDDDRG